ncbi:hypothetical protein DH2020_014182 [Rehmannia glutinosa]|uniref:GTD-binding domain-containing protein n=1 Tax=Rehmannia glutinosa TaxID=99300 RepID=A0ABR0WVN3_REHGL
MADYGTVISENDISALKDTLCAQQNLLQKLYNELDAEREASASAASEALSVILRLQGEKAAVKMEAEQYKRLSEEKMCHAEESLAIIEDIIYQKEMEIAALDCQVEAYRYKLLSMGCVDFGIGETKFRDYPLQRNENLAGETSFQGIGRRNSGPLSFKYKNMIDERDGSCIQEMDFIFKFVEGKRTGQEMYDQASDSDKKTDNSVDSYWEQIRKLDVRVKEIAGADYTNSRSETRSSSLSSRRSSGNLCDLSNSANLRVETRSPSPQINPNHSNKVAAVNENIEIKGSANMSKNGVAVDYPCSPSIHDVFEVPQTDRNFSSCESLAKDENETARLVRKDVVHPEAVEEKLYARNEPDWLKKVLKLTHHEKQLCGPSGIASIDCHLAVVEPTTRISESRPGLYQLNRTSEIVEVERPAECTSREEELKLLNEIKEQINSLHEEIRV